MFARNPYIIETRVYRKRRKRERRYIKCSRINSELRQTRDCFDKRRINAYLSTPLRVFRDKGYVSESFVVKTIKVPTVFSFKHDFDGAILFFKKLLSSFFYGRGTVYLDFSSCKKACIASFMQLHLLLHELNLFLKRYNYKLVRKNNKWFKIIPSKNEKILKYLNALGIDWSTELQHLSNDDLFLPLRLHVGRLRKAYHENTKGIVVKRIQEFINEAIRANQAEFSPKGKSYIRGLIDEVLGNAEDHSIKNSDWYVNGVAFRELQHDTNIVELNLAIINYGDSMYEGFEKTKDQNSEHYQVVQKTYNVHAPLLSQFSSFGKEGLFTMYMLNEGISRLKFQAPSRGNGTINFLEAFILLGGLGEQNSKFNSELNIITGHTVLTCDNKVRPYTSGNFKVVSLNKSQNQKELPDNDYLRDHQEYFPGTILECRIYMNKDYFRNVIHKN